MSESEEEAYTRGQRQVWKCPSCTGSGWAVTRADRITVAGGPCQCVGGLCWANNNTEAVK